MKLKKIKKLNKKYGVRPIYLWQCLTCLDFIKLTALQTQQLRVLPCGCETRSKVYKHVDPYDILVNHWALTAKSHCKLKKRIFKLNKFQIKMLLKSNCFYCGHPGRNTFKLERQKVSFIKYNGIDRIDTSRGYEVDNVVTCCSICNRAKMDLSLDDFLNWIVRVYNHQLGDTQYDVEE